MQRIFSFPATVLLISLSLSGYTQKDLNPPAITNYDLDRDPVLYTVGYAHLDTEWRWDYEETVNDFLKATLDDNFLRFDKYPQYVFTFSGARRYRMMKQYYPEKFAKLKKYVAQNRWFVGGSSVDECDANIPSPESIIRQVLYGNNYFRNEFGKTSVDFLLPDCFGFQAHLPSVLSHAGVRGFSTQKLGWGSAAGIPFNIGRWVGLNGEGVLAALNATDYTGRIERGLDTVAYWVNRVEENGKKYGVFADYRYYGVGDVGGAPREEDIRNAIAAMNNPGRKIHINLTSSDRLFRDLSEEQASRLPTYTGDLLLTEHSAGSLTSQSWMKRWNRKNELLAQATESLATMADWLGGMKYPKERLNEAWWLVLGSQMHDILPGTCIPKAYNYAWNDEVLAQNQFAAVLTDAAGVVARAMDTRVKGKCILVVNTLSNPRTDLVDAEVNFPDGVPEAVKILDPDGKEVPFQLISSGKYTLRILFLASLPSFGLACYDIQEAEKPGTYRTDLVAAKNTLENSSLKITVNSDGDIAGIFSKKINKEILSAPSGLVFLKEHPGYWPAWNMDWKDRKNPLIERVKGPSTITLTENGPIRLTYRIERKGKNSVFIQFVRLVTGADAVLIYNLVYWQSTGFSLKAAFPLTASNTVATYNLGCGTLERPGNDEKKFEVPHREWFDLTDKSGTYGVTILEDGKFASDKPGDKELRLTLLYTPKTNSFHDQGTQDWGVHTFSYGIYPHKGDWRSGQSEWKARSLNQPLQAFQSQDHPGFLGKRFSFCSVSIPQVEIRVMKKAESGAGIVVRLQELWGKETGRFDVTFTASITSAWEVDGQEQRIRETSFNGNTLPVEMGKYGLKSYLVTLDPPADSLTGIVSIELPMPYDLDAVSSRDKKKNGSFNEEGWAYPSELFPDRISFDGVTFRMGNKTLVQNNVLACRGQKILLPKSGNFNKLYILAAALKDTTGTFRTSAGKTNIRIQGFKGNIGQAYNRIWDGLGRISGLEKGFIKQDEVAWFATYMYHDTLTMPYQYGYIFSYSVDAGPGASYLQLPDNPAIRIFAITAAANPYDAIRHSSSLYEDFSDHPSYPLILPRSYASDHEDPSVTIKSTLKRKLNELPGRVTLKDFADIHQPNGVVVRYFYNTSDSSFRLMQDGITLTGLTDGMFVLMENDTLNDCWTEHGEGRIWMDLQRDTEFDSIHLFAAVNKTRGPLSFSLWSASGTKTPDPKGDPRDAGWKFMGYVAPIDIWGNSNVLYTLLPEKGKSVRQRYLMLISEPSGAGFGPYYFREIDFFERQK